MRLSYTKLKTSDCPFRFNQIYNLKNKEPRSDILDFGITIHRIFERYVNIVLSGNVPGKVEILNLMGLIPEKFQYRYREIEDIYDTFIRKVTINPHEVVGAEEFTAIDKDGKDVDGDDPSAVYCGYIDLEIIAGNKGEIWDYKTNRHIESESDIKADYQMPGYAWLLHSKYPFIEFPITVKKYFARYGVFREVQIEREDLQYFRKIVLDRIKSIESWEEFPPTICDSCKYCHLVDRLCPISDEVKDNLNIHDEDTANEAVSRIHVMDSALKKIKRDLKSYMKSKDLGEVGRNVKYGWKKVESQIYPIKEVIELAISLGIDITEVVKPKTRTELAAVFRKYGTEVEAAFENIADIDYSLRFCELKNAEINNREVSSSDGDERGENIGSGGEGQETPRREHSLEDERGERAEGPAT